jgi:hypothetical protein
VIALLLLVAPTIAGDPAANESALWEALDRVVNDTPPADGTTAALIDARRLELAALLDQMGRSRYARDARAFDDAGRQCMAAGCALEDLPFDGGEGMLWLRRAWGLYDLHARHAMGRLLRDPPPYSPSVPALYQGWDLQEPCAAWRPLTALSEAHLPYAGYAAAHCALAAGDTAGGTAQLSALAASLDSAADPALAAAVRARLPRSDQSREHAPE